MANDKNRICLLQTAFVLMVIIAVVVALSGCAVRVLHYYTPPPVDPLPDAQEYFDRMDYASINLLSKSINQS